MLASLPLPFPHLRGSLPGAPPTGGLRPGALLTAVLLALLLPSLACAPRDGTPAGGADPAEPAAPRERPEPSEPSEPDEPDAPAPSERDEPSGAPEPPEAPARVRSGAEVLLGDSLHLVQGRRVGLLTNHTGIVEAGPDSVVSTVILLHERPDLELVALYGPEHGLAGGAAPGEQVASGRHPGTGLPVYSLYGETHRPLPHMLEGVEVLLFDMQDIGARYFTYVSTMALAMEAAGEAGIPFVVLDRPDPVDGVHVQGNVLDPAFSTFVGMYPVPMRHGMTAGELARLYVGEFDIDVDLRVVPMEGWERAMLFGDTGLPWIPPSPNMPSVESALHYPGTCLFEGTNLSVGRGTELPYQQIGAPWLDGEALAARMAARDLPGVRFEAATFTPEDPADAKFDAERVRGVRLRVTDPTVYDPTRTAVALLVESRRIAGERWRWNEAHVDRLAGTDRLRTGIEAGRSADELTAGWDAEVAAFLELREPFLLYR